MGDMGKVNDVDKDVFCLSGKNPTCIIQVRLFLTLSLQIIQ